MSLTHHVDGTLGPRAQNHSPVRIQDEEEDRDESECGSISSGAMTPSHRQQYQDLPSSHSPYHPSLMVRPETSAISVTAPLGLVHPQHHVMSALLPQPSLHQWQSSTTPSIATTYRGVIQAHPTLAAPVTTPIITSQHASQTGGGLCRFVHGY